MNHRERMLTALDGGKPDRLPATIHGWMDYWRDTYMDGADQLDIYRHFDMDAQIFYFAWLDEPVVSAMYFTGDLVQGPEWRVSYETTPIDQVSARFRFTIETPSGTLTKIMERNDKMAWIAEFPIKEKDQIYWIRDHMPLPRPDVARINRAFEEMGDAGILRAGIFNHQGGCWQDACNYVGAQKLIMATYDDPAWVHEFLGIILDYKLRFIESLRGVRIDMLENGGGDGSMSVISPALFAEYCVPYDRQTTAALHDVGIKVVYHTCGKMMAQLDLVKQVGADASETLTPTGMGGDADLRAIKAALGDEMALIGGFNQQTGFRNGNPVVIREQIETCWEQAGRDGGFILGASDHFFAGEPENIRAFVEIAREFRY